MDMIKENEYMPYKIDFLFQTKCDVSYNFSRR